jgi:hypothetical protein
MKLFLVGWVLVGVVSSGCLRETRTRGGAFEPYTDVPLFKTPADRCATYTGKNRREACNEARMLGEIFVRKLSVGDEVCLDGGFGDSGRGACSARAAIADTATGKDLIEVREASPGSTWFGKEQRQFWFEEGALVDLYLKDHGY